MPIAYASDYCYYAEKMPGFWSKNTVEFNKQSYAPHDSPGIHGYVDDCLEVVVTREDIVFVPVEGWSQVNSEVRIIGPSI